ncbi:hypothetical protein BDA99DRAFT_541953 [Phascolomyces articulosus]|uniref:Uncharacterized protein n=1 Tax=Phascolomyces articulosus TaxID=60185 RepID=A0AAD5K1Y9_9FUNG|nr:hypothetical protein BDA99DRAFT_541953 [Phascolomyces articulosus]
MQSHYFVFVFLFFFLLLKLLFFLKMSKYIRTTNLNTVASAEVFRSRQMTTPHINRERRAISLIAYVPTTAVTVTIIAVTFGTYVLSFPRRYSISGGQQHYHQPLEQIV